MELVVLSAAPGSPAEDGLRLLAGLGEPDGDARSPVNAHVREQLDDARPSSGTPHR
jgi:hypothetical protein